MFFAILTLFACFDEDANLTQTLKNPTIYVEEYTRQDEIPEFENITVLSTQDCWEVNRSLQCQMGTWYENGGKVTLSSSAVIIRITYMSN